MNWCGITTHIRYQEEILAQCIDLESAAEKRAPFTAATSWLLQRR
jgi:hypothetical protein